MRSALLMAMLLFSIAPAAAQNNRGDPEAGKVLALKVCSTCHAVAGQQTRPAMDSAPSFPVIARDPAVTEAGLHAFLQTPHSVMPDLILSRDEIRDVIAYIMSLKPATPPSDTQNPSR